MSIPLSVEKQGHDECMLSTIAALAEMPLGYVRGIALAGSGACTWGAHMPFGTYYKGVSFACHVLDPSGKLNALVDYTKLHPTASEPAVTRLSRKVRKLPANGRGTVTLRRGLRAHIAPWADGLIYDPNLPTAPVDLTTFRRRYNMTVYAITYTKEG